MKLLDFSEFVNENYKVNEMNNISRMTMGVISPKIKKAAGLIQSLLSRKMKIDWKMYPYTYYSNEVDGVLLLNDKTTQAVIIGEPNKGTPGVVGSISYMTDYMNTKAEFTLTSSMLPIVKLIDEFIRMATDSKYMKLVAENLEIEKDQIINENLAPAQVQEIEKELDSGKSIAEISRTFGIPYSQIRKVKLNTDVAETREPIVKKNEKSLEDKVKFLDETMKDIYDISRRVAAGGFNSLFISGRAGTGKTYNVEKAMQDEGLKEEWDYVKISGAVSVIEMFRKLYQYNDKVLIFDDADAVFRDENGRNILKGALDTKKVRNISYLKRIKALYDPKDFETDPEGEVAALDAGLVPNKFDFTGRVIFISNLAKDKADPDGAIRSRSILIDVNPDDATLMEKIKLMLPVLDPIDMPLDEKEEIFNFMKKAKNVSMRTFVKAAGFKQAGLANWERMANRYL